MGEIDAAQDERLPGAGQRLGRAEVDEAAVVDHDQPVADLLQLAQQVRGHEDRPSALGDFTDQAADVLHADWIESVGRFVEDDQLGVSEQRGGDAETLLHAHRVGIDAVAAAAGEVDEVDEIGDVLPSECLPSTARERRLSIPDAAGWKAGRLDQGADAVEVAGRLAERDRRARWPEPLVGWTRPSSIAINVVLPAPFGPISPATAPVGMANESPSTAVRLP